MMEDPSASVCNDAIDGRKIAAMFIQASIKACVLCNTCARRKDDESRISRDAASYPARTFVSLVNSRVYPKLSRLILPKSGCAWYRRQTSSISTKSNLEVARQSVGRSKYAYRSYYAHRVFISAFFFFFFFFFFL